MNTDTQRRSSPRRRLPGALFAAVAALAVAIPDASLAAPVFWGPATNISGESDVSTAGTLVGAFNIGGEEVASAIVNGVTFEPFPLETGAAEGSVGAFFLGAEGVFFPDNFLFGSDSPPFSDLSSDDYKTILRSGTLVIDEPDMEIFEGCLIIVLSELIPGCTYQFQWWANLSTAERPPDTQYHVAFTFEEEATDEIIILNDNTNGMEGGLGQYGIGTFTADSTEQFILICGVSPDEIPGTEGPSEVEPGPFGMINAFQLRKLDCHPALVYDCAITGKFKYSWMDEVEDDELCLYGQGLSTRVNLKAFYVQGVLQPPHECEVDAAESSSGICDSCTVSETRDPEEACAVKIIYGECQTSEGTQKFYWFASGYDFYDPNPFSPDFCNLHVEDCLNQIDSVCDGITLKNNEMLMKFTKGSKSPVYGTKLYRNLFKYTDNFDECDKCPPWVSCDSQEQSADDCEYECVQDSIEVTALDIAGALSKCTISTTREPKTMPFNYLNFCDYQEDPNEKVSDDICAPKTLCGPFYSYWASLDGRSYYPSPDDICINNDLTIEGNSERGNPGYLFASIEACAKYRLNTSMTACANLLADVCKAGDSEEEGYGYLNHESHENPVADECGCTVRQGTLNYGVLCVALYLESKGYEFNKYGTENIIRKGVGLPSKDN